MANNLKKIREERKISLEDLAKKIGTTRQNVSYYETGRMTASFAEKCAVALDVSAIDILGKDAITVSKLTPEDKEKLLKIIKEF